jgi:hypothetical protein
MEATSMAAEEPPTWEPKPIAVLTLAFALPASDDVSADYEPWTLLSRWERTIRERIDGFGGAIVEKSPSRLSAVYGVPRALEPAARNRRSAPPCTSAKSTSTCAPPIRWRACYRSAMSSACPNACSDMPVPARSSFLRLRLAG